MKKLAIAVASSFAVAASAAVWAQEFKARLIGYEEVPSVSTPASGEFKAKFDKKTKTLDYELSYSNLQGSISQAHIHFAQPGVNGSIVIWLCQVLPQPPNPVPPAAAAGAPVCTQPNTGTVFGSITAAEVIAAGTASQLISAGELDEVIAAMEAGFAYANVHTLPLNPGGEIRGQIKK